MVVGKPDLVAKNHLGVRQGVGNGAGADVAVEHAGVQHQQLDEGGEAALPRLQDHVLAVHLVIQRFLRRVHLEDDAAAILVGDGIEVVEPPQPVQAVAGDAPAFIPHPAARLRPAVHGSGRRSA